MLAARTVIAWTPSQIVATCPARRATSGTVRLLNWPEEAEAADDYANLDGAACPLWRAASHEQLVAGVFIVYAKMVLNGVNPLAAHMALMGLDEYRANLPPELAAQTAAPIHTAPVVNLDCFRIAAEGDRGAVIRLGATAPIPFPDRPHI